jgi:serine/threonine protein kinase
MNGGSLFDLIHNLGGIFHLPAVIRIAIDVSKGMDYLHQCDIIHRDLKTANLLMDEKEVCSIFQQNTNPPIQF